MEVSWNLNRGFQSPGCTEGWVGWHGRAKCLTGKACIALAAFGISPFQPILHFYFISFLSLPACLQRLLVLSTIIPIQHDFSSPTMPSPAARSGAARSMQGSSRQWGPRSHSRISSNDTRFLFRKAVTDGGATFRQLNFQPPGTGILISPTHALHTPSTSQSTTRLRRIFAQSLQILPRYPLRAI